MDVQARDLMHRMLQPLHSGPIDPDTLTEAAFGVLCWGLAHMTDDERREQLLAALERNARSNVAGLMIEAAGGDRDRGN